MELVTVIRGSTVAYYVTHEDGRIVEANDATARLLGFDSMMELQGRRATEFIDTSQRAVEWEQLRQGGEVIDHEITLKDRDGNPVRVRDFCRLIQADGDNPGYAVGVMLPKH